MKFLKTIAEKMLLRPCSYCRLIILDYEKVMFDLFRYGMKYSHDERASLIAHAPARMCPKCSGKICVQCQDKSWNNFPNCPHCGSPMDVMDWNWVYDDSIFEIMMDMERRKHIHIG